MKRSDFLKVVGGVLAGAVLGIVGGGKKAKATVLPAASVPVALPDKPNGLIGEIYGVRFVEDSSLPPMHFRLLCPERDSHQIDSLRYLASAPRQFRDSESAAQLGKIARESISEHTTPLIDKCPFTKSDLPKVRKILEFHRASRNH